MVTSALNLSKAKVLKSLVYYVWGDQFVVQKDSIVVVDLDRQIAFINSHHVEIKREEFKIL